MATLCKAAAMAVPELIDVSAALAGLSFLPNRTPHDDDESDAAWVKTLSDYRDGGIYVVHWAGESEWERHPADELVLVIDGSTTMTLLIDGDEHQRTLGAMQMIVVPEMIWHRFSTPDGVKVFSISPQPSDHQIDHP